MVGSLRAETGGMVKRRLDVAATTTRVLTYVREPAGRSFAELFGLVRQCHLDDTGYGPGRCLYLYGVRSQ